MAVELNFDHYGEAYLGRLIKTQSMSFGMESKKMNKASAGFLGDISGVAGGLSVGDSKLGGSLNGNANFGHLGAVTEIDFTKGILPQVKLKGEADILKFGADAKYYKSGREHKIASGELNVFGGSFSVEGGGKTYLPYLKGEGHTLSTKTSAGYDEATFNASLGDGPSASFAAALRDFKMDATGEGLKDTYNNVINAVKNPSEAIRNQFYNAGVNKESSLGQVSYNIPGGISTRPDGAGGVIHQASVGQNTLSDIKGYRDALTGKSGNENGSWDEVNSSSKNRENLFKDAEKLHKKNEKGIEKLENKNAKRIERLEKKGENVGLDGKRGLFETKKSDSIADKSSGFVDRLSNAIDQASAQKQAIDDKLANIDLSSKEAFKLSKQSQRLGDEIGRMTDARNKLSSDRDWANGYLNRNSFSNSNIPSKSTEQIVEDAKANSQRFESEFKKQGMKKNLAESAVGVCNSKNELNRRIAEYDRKLSANDNIIVGINAARDNYLKDNGLTLKEAIDKNDPKIAVLNKHEMLTRQKGAALRGEKGECQKALLDVDKNYMPREQSEKFEERGRELQFNSIDNKNDIATKEDDIANYCNSKGITKDENGNYSIPDKQTELGLQNLLNEKANLENKEKGIKKDIDSNKKDLAESEKKGKTSVRVNEVDGDAKVDVKNIDYGMHAVDNKDLRDNKDYDGVKEPLDEKGLQTTDPKQTDEKGPQTIDPKQTDEKGPRIIDPKQTDEKGPQTTELKQTDEKGLQTTNPKQTDEKAPQTIAPKQTDEKVLQTTNPKQTDEKGPQTTNPKQMDEKGSQTTDPKQTNEKGPQTTASKKTEENGPKSSEGHTAQGGEKPSAQSNNGKQSGSEGISLTAANTGNAGSGNNKGASVGIGTTNPNSENVSDEKRSSGGGMSTVAAGQKGEAPSNNSGKSKESGQSL